MQGLITAAGGFGTDASANSWAWGPLVGAALVAILGYVFGDLNGTTLASLRALAAREDPVPVAPAGAVRLLGAQERAKRAFVKLLLAAATLGTGNSLGPEGPSVEFGGNVAAFLSGFGEEKEVTGRTTTSDQRLRLLACGAAAGVAAGFNAPVSGIIFAVEVVQPPQSEQRAVNRLLAAAIAASVAQLGLGYGPAIQGIEFSPRPIAETYWELPLYMVLGILCGAVSAGFGFLLERVVPLFVGLTTLGVPRLLHPFIGSLSLVLFVAASTLPAVCYQGFGNVNEVLRYAGTMPVGKLLELLAGKLVLTAIAVGSGLVGGLFAPSLFIGSVTGALFGQFLASVQGFVGILASGATDFAAVGAAACLGATCGVPCTAVVLLLELDNGADYAAIGLPLILGVGCAVYSERLWVRQGKDVSSKAILKGSSFSPVDEARLEAMFESLDRDGDGTVSSEEFRQWICRLEDKDAIFMLSLGEEKPAGVPAKGRAQPKDETDD